MADPLHFFRQFEERSSKPEEMDDLLMGGPRMIQTLDQLAVINKWLGGQQAVLHGFRQLVKQSGIAASGKTLTVIDVGCGGGDSLRRIAKWARQKKIPFAGMGIDANPFIVEYARQRSAGFPELKFQAVNVFSDAFRALEADVFLCSLFLHHFPEEEIRVLLEQMASNAHIGVAVSDLHRHWLAYCLFGAVTYLFGASPMIRNDGLLSIKKGFRRRELEELLSAGSFSAYSLKWKWAFRYKILI